MLRQKKSLILLVVEMKILMISFIRYPAVLIGRLGVAKNFQGTNDGIGSQAIDYIISWFLLPDNKTGCRFIVVDAYNKENVLRFYEKNGFKFLYSTEELEKEANHIPEDERKHPTPILAV